MIKITSVSEQQTKNLAASLGAFLKPGDIVCLYGDLGAGKTTFVKGLGLQFNIDEHKIVSPTYVLLNIYEGTEDLYHFDLYRLDNLNQIHTLGYEEYFYGDGISLIEWPERLGDEMPKEYLKVEIAHLEEGREITMTPIGQRYVNLLGQIKI